MHLGKVEARGFKSLLDIDVPLRQGVTVIVGENNAGKSNFIDALRLLTDPLDGRRNRWWEPDDVHPWADGGAQLTAVYAGLEDVEAATHLQARVPASDEPDLQKGNHARYSVAFARPPARPKANAPRARSGRRGGCWTTRSPRHAARSATCICRRCAMPSRSWPPARATDCG